MTFMVSDYLLDAGIEAMAEADQACVCAGQPLTFYEAVDPAAWAASTAYALGDVVRPTTRNGFVYEVTAAGTSSGTEPVSWPTTPGNTVVDGGVTFTARTNRALYSSAMAGGDYALVNGDVSGRKVTMAAKTNIAVHTSGTADHQAYVDTAAKRLLFITTAITDLPVTGGSSTASISAAQWEVRDAAIA